MKKIDKQELHILFEGIRNNNKDSFDTLYEKYKSLVYGVSFTICKNNEIADEVTQNVFFKIWKLSEEKLPTEYEASWLYTITKNETIDVLRKNFDFVDIDSICNIKNYHNDVEDIIDIDNFNNMINVLKKDDEKQIVSLKVVSDFTFKEIGILLNIPTATVQWKYYKSIKFLKLALANLAMFILTFAFYLKTRPTSNKNISKLSRDNFMNDSNNIVVSPNSSKVNSVTPSSIQSDTYSGVESATILRDYSNAITLGVSSIFLILTLIFAIFVKKHQQKVKLKTSKHYMKK